MTERFSLLVAALAAALALAAGAVRAAELVMVEEAGCIWCARWNREIAEIYPKTPEGRAAPLRRIDKRAPVPEDLDLARPVSFTPTFVLVVGGTEKARIEGYPGEDFFWGLLSEHLEAHTDFRPGS